MRRAPARTSPARQSATSPRGWAEPRRVVQHRGGDDVAAHAEVLGRQRGERARSRRTVPVGARLHGGGTAWLNECTNGCMSVIDRSCFSYQVAAGSTMSVQAVVVMRKSTLTQGRACPRGISSRQRTSPGARPRAAARPAARRGGGAEQVAQEVLLALARGAEQVRAPDEEHAGSSRARSGPRPRTAAACLSSETTCAGGSAPAARLVGEVRGLRSNWERRHPAHPHRLGVRVDRRHPREQPGAERARRTAPGAGGRSATARCACSTRTCPAPGAAAGASRARTPASASRRRCGSSPARRSAPSRRR